jgi:hypothetical protein
MPEIMRLIEIPFKRESGIEQLHDSKQHDAPLSVTTRVKPSRKQGTAQLESYAIGRLGASDCPAGMEGTMTFVL